MQINLIQHDIAWKFHPHTFDQAWHCMWISSKYFWSNMTLHRNFMQINLIQHDIAWKFHPHTFDLAWHCMWISSKCFWSSMTLHKNFVQIILIWHDIAWKFHPHTSDLAWHCTWNSSKYFDAWYCIWISSKYFGSWHCMWNIIHILWPQWHCMCFSNGHCELKCHLQNLQMYINFPSLFGGLKKENLQQESLAYWILTSKISSKWFAWILSIGTDHNCMILHRFYFYFYFIFFGLGVFFSWYEKIDEIVIISQNMFNTLNLYLIHFSLSSHLTYKFF